MNDHSSDTRRDFLKTVILLAGAAVAAPTASNALTTGQPVLTPAEPSSAGYKETVHISKYYQTARD